MIARIEEEYLKHDKINAASYSKVANKIYKEMPIDNIEFLKKCDELIKSDERRIFSVGTLLIQKRKSLIDIKYFDFYEKWATKYVNGWDQCDQFCSRVTTPMLEKYPELYDKLVEWSNESEFTIKRISLVSMTGSTTSVVVDFDKVIHIVDKLKYDEEVLIQKAVGWILKCCYKNYPKQLEEYLIKNHDSLSRIIFRYSLEYMPKDKKEELLKLQKC